MDLYNLHEESENLQYISLEVTVASGFESSALSEIKEKISPVFKIFRARGRVYFSTRVECLDQVLKLRSIDHVHLIISVRTDKEFSNEKNIALTDLTCLIESSNWKKTISIWRNVSQFKGNCFPSKEEYNAAHVKEVALKEIVNDLCIERDIIETAKCNELVYAKITRRDSFERKRNELKKKILRKEDRKNFYQSTDHRLEEDKVLKFRMTCNRTGDHSFTSPDVASSLGGILQEKFNWVVELVHHDLEVIVNVRNDQAYMTVSLTKDSLHKRNILKFGPTTLRATVCFNLLQLAAPSVGDIILDPLCGGGSIPIEGALAFSNCYNLGGDNHPMAISRACDNVQYMQSIRKGYVDVTRWDVTKLPLRDACIDVLVTDLPFGKRSGSKYQNQFLYQKAMLETARCVVPAGRAVCLTWDKTNLIRTIRSFHLLWSIGKIVPVNLGGLQATAYVLKRTCESLDTFFRHLKAKGKKKWLPEK